MAKTLDQQELLGQELLLLALRKWADLVRPGLPVMFTRLDVQMRNMGLDWNQNVTQWLIYSGLFTVGNVEVRFKCVFNWKHLWLQQRWDNDGLYWQNTVSDKSKKPFFLEFSEKDDEGMHLRYIKAKISGVGFKYHHKSSKGWKVTKLEVDHNEDILVAIRKRLKGRLVA